MMICTAAINSTYIQKYNPAIPTSEESRKIAALNIFLVVTASRPETNMSAEII